MIEGYWMAFWGADAGGPVAGVLQLFVVAMLVLVVLGVGLDTVRRFLDKAGKA